MKSFHHKIIELAIREALKSDYQHRIGAVIFHQKTIISTGYNKPFSFARNLHPKYCHYPTSIHAEVRAILSAKTDLKGCEICVIRINRAIEKRLSLPCPHCMSYLQDVGIKRIWYSDNDGKIKSMKVRG